MKKIKGKIKINYSELYQFLNSTPFTLSLVLSGSGVRKMSAGMLLDGILSFHSFHLFSIHFTSTTFLISTIFHAPTSSLPFTGERVSGQDVRTQNVTAAVAIANIVKTSLGTYTHIRIHTCILAYLHTYIHTYMHACIHTHSHTNIHILIQTYTCVIQSSLTIPVVFQAQLVWIRC